MSQPDPVADAFERWRLARSNFGPGDEARFFEALDPDLAEALEARISAFERTYRAIAGAGVEGQQIGRYKLISVVGRGASGVVWRAQMDDGSLVALKLLYFSHTSNPTIQTRLSREAAILAQLRHPGIVEFRDTDTHLGMPYLVTELIDPPKTLDDQFREWRETSRRDAAFFDGIASTLAAVCRAVAYAHANGVLHRDLSPRNVLIAEGSTPKVTDFGLAIREIDGSLTGSGQVLGTIRYMSPEHADPSLGSLSEKSDTFSLGTMLFEALTGEPAFRGESLAAVRRELLIGDPPTARDIDPRVPKQLAAIATRAIAHGTSQRYSSADQMACDLESHLTGNGSTHRRGRLRSLFARKYRRYPRATTACLAAIAILIATSVALREMAAARDAVTQVSGEFKRTRYRSQLFRAQVQLSNGAPRVARRLLLETPETLRGWEWNHFYARTDTTLGRHAVHSGSILAIASIGSRDVLTVGSDGRIVVNDIEGTLGARILGGDGGARSAQLSPDSSSVLVATPDHRLQAWSLSGGRWLDVQKPNVEWCGWIDSETLFSCSLGGDLEILDIRSPEDPKTVASWEVIGPVIAAGSLGQLVSTARDRSLVLWESDGTELLRFDPAAALVVQLLWVPQRNEALAVDSRGAVYRWNPTTSTAVQLELQHTASHVAVSADGAQIAYVTPSSDVHVHQALSEHSTQLHGATSGITALCFSPDGERVLAADAAGRVTQWLTVDAGPVMPLFSSRFPVTSLEVDDHGSCVALSTRIGATYLFDTEAGELRRRFVTHSGAATGTAFARNAASLTTCGPDGEIHLLDTYLKSPMGAMELGRPIRSISLSPDGTQIAATLRSGDLLVGNATGSTLAAVDADSDWKTSDCRFADADGLLVVRLRQQNDVLRWRIEQIPITPGRPPRAESSVVLTEGTGRPTAFDSDSTGLVALVLDGHRVLVFDRVTNSIRSEFHTESKVAAIAIRGAAQRVFVANGRNLSVYDLDSADPLIRMHADGTITHMSASRSGSPQIQLVIQGRDLVAWTSGMPTQARLATTVDRMRRLAMAVVAARDGAIGDSTRCATALRSISSSPDDATFMLELADALGPMDAREINEIAWKIVHTENASADERSWAFQALVRAAELEPGDAFIQHSLGVAAISVDEWEHARIALTTADALDRQLFGSSRAETLAYLSVAHLALGDPTASSMLIEGAEKLAIDKGEPSTKLSLLKARRLLKAIELEAGDPSGTPGVESSSR